MREEPRHFFRPLPKRSAVAQDDRDPSAERHQDRKEGEGGRQPSKFPLLLLVALATIAIIALISVFQLVDAALG